MQRGTPHALRLLAAARQGRPPQQRVETLHLMQQLLELHRQAYECTGGEPSLALPELQRQIKVQLSSEKCKGAFSSLWTAV